MHMHAATAMTAHPRARAAGPPRGLLGGFGAAALQIAADRGVFPRFGPQTRGGNVRPQWSLCLPLLGNF